MSTAAAKPLSRAALLALLTAFIVGGLFGRDPWYDDDAAGFGVMWTMAHGSAIDWLLPNIAGELVADSGPLAYWVGAVFIRLFGAWLGDATAARLTTVLWFFVATSAVWYATYRWARRDEAQPVAFVFGGEAKPRDYGRMLADIAVLLFMAALGLVVRVHETTDLAASAALAGLALLGLAVALEHAWRGALLVGVAAGLLALARDPLAGLAVAIGAVAAMCITLPRTRRIPATVLALAMGVAVFMIWPVASLLAPEMRRAEFVAEFRSAVLGALGFPRIADVMWLLRTLAWYAWPLWPFAIWSVYAWRQGLARAHIAAPAIVCAILLVSALAAPRSEAPLVLLAAPLAVLAAFGAASVRRTMESATDWFAIVTFSFVAAVGWAYYVAMMTGSPRAMAASISRLTPGFAPPADAPAIAAAGFASAVWIAVVVWRVARHPAALWRGPLLLAVGMTTLWLLLNALFLPAINYSRSYAPLARAIRQQIVSAGGAAACVYGYRLRPAHRALLAYHGGIRFSRGNEECDLVLQRDQRNTGLDDAPPAGDWRVVWEDRWAARPNEVFRLYRRALR